MQAEYLVTPVVPGSTLSPAAIDATLAGAAPAPVAAAYTVNAQVDGSDASILAVDSESGADLWDFRPEGGALGSLGTDGVLIDRHAADDDGLTVGDTLDVSVIGGGERTYSVRAIGDTRPFGTDYVIDAADITDLDPNAPVSQLLIGEGPSEEQLEQALASFPNAEVNTPDSLAKSLDQIINLLLSVLLGFLGLSVLIAFLGVANTLALSIHERTRELGILRAIALRRSHIRAAVRWEAAIISVLGTLLGVLFGAGFGITLTTALEDTGFVRLDVPWGQLVLVVVLAAVAGTLAAALPARRAAKLDILDAIHEL